MMLIVQQATVKDTEVFMSVFLDGSDSLRSEVKIWLSRMFNDPHWEEGSEEEKEKALENSRGERTVKEVKKI